MSNLMVCISDTPCQPLTGSRMFPEYRDLISRLKNENPRLCPCSINTINLIMKLPERKVRRSRVQCGSGPHEKTKATVKDEMLKILQQESIKEV